MTIYFIDSFSDRSAFPMLGWKYAQTQIGNTVVAGFPTRTAPTGQAWAQTAQGSFALEYARTIGTMGHWVIGIRIKPTLDGVTSDVFLRLQTSQTIFTDQDATNGTTQFCAIYGTDGTMSFYSGGSGTQVTPGTLIYSATPSQKLVSGTWTYLEFDIQFGATGSLTVMQDDVLFCSVSGISIGPTFPDRFAFLKSRSFYGDALLAIGDIYVADQLLGPVKVTAWAMGGDSIPQGFTRSGAIVHPFNYQQIDEFPPTVGANPYPDNDTTYVFNDSAAAVTDLYRPGSVPCYGKILAVALNLTVRATSGSPNVTLQVRQGATRYGLTSLLIVPVGNYIATANAGIVPPGTGAALYTQLQGITITQPNGNGDWDDRAIGNADLGMLSDNGGIFRCTNASLEKLVSLRNVPFDCAGGSYSF